MATSILYNKLVKDVELMRRRPPLEWRRKKRKSQRLRSSLLARGEKKESGRDKECECHISVY